MSGAGAAATADELRLFVAIDLPADVQRRLLRLVPAASGVRPVAAGQVHLTLHFLGGVAAAAVEPLTTALAGVAWHGFPLVLAGGGRFPPRGPASVLWVGVRESGPLRGLHSALAAAMRDHGLPVETRPFVPHVTVARLARHAGRAAVDDFLRAADQLEPLEVGVDRFHLYRSDRGPAGQVHAVLRSFPSTG
ncbi:MAG: RNA 2',3'-cyclic phosphodiesterase [Planctomycetia bacterium]